MKLLISFLFSIFILFSNLSASENTQKLTPKINNEQLQELIKKLPRENSFTQNTSNEDWFKKLRPFIVPLLIVLFLIFRSDSKNEDRLKKILKLEANVLEQKNLLKSIMKITK